MSKASFLDESSCPEISPNENRLPPIFLSFEIQ
jgi:hypothetical protein